MSLDLLHSTVFAIGTLALVGTVATLLSGFWRRRVPAAQAVFVGGMAVATATPLVLILIELAYKGTGRRPVFLAMYFLAEFAASLFIVILPILILVIRSRLRKGWPPLMASDTSPEPGAQLTAAALDTGHTPAAQQMLLPRLVCASAAAIPVLMVQPLSVLVPGWQLRPGANLALLAMLGAVGAVSILGGFIWDHFGRRSPRFGGYLLAATAAFVLVGVAPLLGFLSAIRYTSFWPFVASLPPAYAAWAWLWPRARRWPRLASSESVV